MKYAWLLSLFLPVLLVAQESPQRIPPERLLQQFDANGDGRISRDEAPDRMQQRWNQIDTDTDGFVTLGELTARDARASGARSADRPAPAGDFAVTIIGSGAPQYNAKRSGPSALIQHHGRHLLVDMGNGTQARLNELGLSPRSLDALLLTHHHLDHNEEFIPILLHRQISGGDVDIVGPPGVARLVDFAGDFYKEDAAYRMGRRGRTSDEAGKARVREVTGGERFMLGEVQVTTAEVPHSIKTVAYRFDAGGKSIVISGDLTYSTNLVELARGADVLVLDAGGALVRQGMRQGGGDRQPAAHPSAQDVRNMARQAGVKKLVLTHIVGTNIDEPATIQSIHEVYKGTVLVGADLLQIAPDLATL
jgi:ribonuclease BN (tRNA processing enzyme)